MKSKPSDFPPAVLEALAAWEAFRKLGFSADDIYVGAVIDQAGDSALGVVLRHGGKQFVYTAGGCQDLDDEQKMLSLWKEAGACWNTKFTEEDRRKVYEGSFISRNSLLLLLAMKDKGFEFGNILVNPQKET